MTEDERFYSTAENTQRESHIEFPSKPSETEGEEPTPTNIQDIVLDSDALKQLEAQVNDPTVRGCKVYVEKLQPQASDDQAKGKAPAKGKPAAAAAGEESKPVKGEAWLDLTPFMYPGCTESL